ncbi:hypothetical protein B194_5445 [Serratia plymuthica A30]|nr:hypothetical protein B194_5445 [Serratia plymuthica A30]
MYGVTQDIAGHTRSSSGKGRQEGADATPVPCGPMSARPGTAAGQADVEYRSRLRQGYAAKAA